MQSQDTIKAHTRGRGTVLCVCEHCKEPFMAKPHRVRDGEARWCSGVCVSRAKKAAYAASLVASPTDLAYLAGLIDGEGSISIIKHNERVSDEVRRVRYRLRLYITNSNRPMMDWIVAHFGGWTSAVTKPSGTIVYRWVASGNSVEGILRLAQPYMISKRPHVDVAIRYCEGVDIYNATHPARHGTGGDQIAHREACWREMSALTLAGGKTRKGPKRGYMMEPARP